MFQIPLMTNTLTYFQVLQCLVALLFILLAVKYWSRKFGTSQYAWIFACDIVLHASNAFEWLILTLSIVYFGTKIAFKSCIRVTDKGASQRYKTALLNCQLVYLNLPTLCRLSAVTTNVMIFCDGNLRRIFIANTELPLFYMVSRYFLKAY